MEANKILKHLTSYWATFILYTIWASWVIWP